MIVITGPTGQIGRKLLAEVLDSDEPIRVIARDPARLPSSVMDRLEVIQGSYEEPSIVAKAFEGADCVFWLPIAKPDAATVYAAFVDMSRPAADAIRRYGIKHVVTVSALGRGWAGEAGHAAASIRMDDMFAETGANLRALACSSLMDNMLRQLGSIRDQGVFYGPSPGDFKTPYVATQDVAAAAADLLLDRSWLGARTLPLLGPEDLSCNDQARIMSDTLGRPVSFRQMSMEDLNSLMRARGASEGMAQAMVDMATAKNDGMDLVTPRTPETTTPTSFRVWCETVLVPAIRNTPAKS